MLDFSTVGSMITQGASMVTPRMLSEFCLEEVLLLVMMYPMVELH
jgi:hypothetical protein